jgi:hypothetical protein
MSATSVTIERRFQGIPAVALGGYVGGLLAGGAESGEVALRRPVPLDRALRLERQEDGTASLADGEEKLAGWIPGPVLIDVPPPVSFNDAAAGESRSLQASSDHEHPFPNCVTCGSARAAGDGLRLFTGPVPGRSVVAARWVPEPAHAGADGCVRPELVWAALDCPTIMALVFASPTHSKERVVTARLGVARLGAIRAGEPHVVMAWTAGRDGRAYVAGGAVRSATGAVLAVGRHLLVPTKWGVQLGVDGWRRAPAP